MTFELIFRHRETGEVVYVVNDVSMIRHITPSEVGFVEKGGRIRSSSFPHTENVEVNRTY